MEKYIELYHGTTSISALKIFESNGIMCRNKTNSDNEAINTTTKQMDAVYLTQKKNSAISYGYDRTDMRGWSVKNNKIVLPVVFTVLINTNSNDLYIDEDYLADDIGKKRWTNFLIKNNVIKKSSESKNWTYFYERKPELAFELLKLFPWTDSLKQSGSVAFGNDITFDNIKYIDIYYDPENYIRLSQNDVDDFQKTYSECCNIILNKYNDKYEDEYSDTNVLPYPYGYEILKSKNNKLDGTIYRNINVLNKLNNLAIKYKYPLFNKIVITPKDNYYMQHNSYIKHIDNINDIFDTNKYLIIDLGDDNILSISYFTYIRNNIGMLLNAKKLINELGYGKSIIFEMKYHDIKFFKNLHDFWNYVNKVEDKSIIIPAKKE